jgi:glycosyltransferase involved in cell wall biosynthesis
VRLRLALVLGTSTGGIGAHVHDLAAGLVTRGHQVTVAGPEQTEEHFGFSRVGAYFSPVPISASVSPGRDLSAVRTLRAALAGTEVVHAHGVRAGALTGLALTRRDTPSVVTLHNAMLASGIRSKLLTGLEKLAVLRADVVLGASEDLVERARTLGARDARLGPVPAPPLPPATRDRAQVRAELGLDDGSGPDARILVLALGRLAPQKDYATLLQAMHILDQARQLAGSSTPAPRLAIAGDGPLRAALQAEIDTQHLDAVLLGHRTDVADLLAAADILALSSTWPPRSAGPPHSRATPRYWSRRATPTPWQAPSTVSPRTPRNAPGCPPAAGSARACGRTPNSACTSSASSIPAWSPGPPAGGDRRAARSCRRAPARSPDRASPRRSSRRPPCRPPCARRARRGCPGSAT